MKTLRAILAGLFFIWSSIAAPAMLTVNELNGFNVGPVAAAGTPTLTFLQCTPQGAASGSVVTVSAQNTGTAGASRSTIIGITAEDSASVFGVNSVTVGGDSASEVIDEDGTGGVDTAIYIISNPADTSEDVVVTFSEALDASEITVCLWQADNLSSITAVAATADDDTASNAVVLDLSATGAGGVAVGVCITDVGGPQTVTWVGLTERFEADVGQNNASAADVSPTNGSALTVSCDWASGSGDASGVAAAFL